MADEILYWVNCKGLAYRDLIRNDALREVRAHQLHGLGHTLTTSYYTRHHPEVPAAAVIEDLFRRQFELGFTCRYVSKRLPDVREIRGRILRKSVMNLFLG